MEVNQVFNWANATSIDAADRNRRANAKFLSGFELCNLSAGATEFFERIGADTIQRICCEYAAKRRAAKRLKLRWRVSRGSRRSLGWVPFKAASVKRKGHALRFCGKVFRVFERDRVAGVKWRDGCFAQDAVGDWWLCLPVELPAETAIAPREAVGIDLGLKEIAVTSDGSAWRRAAGRTAAPRSLRWRSAEHTSGRPRGFIARRRAPVRMRCTSFRGRLSIRTRTSRWAT